MIALRKSDNRADILRTASKTRAKVSASAPVPFLRRFGNVFPAVLFTRCASIKHFLHFTTLLCCCQYLRAKKYYLFYFTSAKPTYRAEGISYPKDISRSQSEHLARRARRNPRTLLYRFLYLYAHIKLSAVGPCLLTESRKLCSHLRAGVKGGCRPCTLLYNC